MDNSINITATDIHNVAVELEHSGRLVASDYFKEVAISYEDQENQIRSLTIENAELLLIIDAQHELLKSRHNYGDHNMNFSLALNCLKEGSAITRTGWNGKHQFLRLQTPDQNSKMSLPYIYITTVTDQRVPWVASQTDLLAEDWEVILD